MRWTQHNGYSNDYQDLFFPDTASVTSALDNVCRKAYSNLSEFDSRGENSFWYGAASISFHKNLNLLLSSIQSVKRDIDSLYELVRSKEELKNTVDIYISSYDRYNDEIDNTEGVVVANRGMPSSVNVSNFSLQTTLNTKSMLWNSVCNNKRVMDNLWKGYNNRLNTIKRKSFRLLAGRNETNIYAIDFAEFEKNIEEILDQLVIQLKKLITSLSCDELMDYVVTISGSNVRTPSCTKTLYLSRATNRIISNIDIIIENANKLIKKIDTHKNNIIKFEKGESVEIIVQNTNETVAPKQEVKTHVVQSGESLASIAAKYNLSWEEIYKTNKDVIGNNPSMIFSGMKLVLPGLVQTSLQSDTSSEIIQNELLVDQTIGGLQNLRSYKEVMATNWGIEADGVLKGEYGNPMQVNEKGVMVNNSGQNNIRISSAMSKSYSNGEYTSKVRTRRTTHNGVDLSGSNVYGTNIQSLGSGIVLEVVTNKPNKAYASASYGNYVKILHEQKDVDGNVNYVVSLYAHMTKNSSSHLKVGSIVNEGDVIGQLGNSGNSTGPHLHLELADTDLTAQEMSGLTAEEILAKVKNEGLGVNKGDYYDMGGYFESKGMVM